MVLIGHPSVEGSNATAVLNSVTFVHYTEGVRELTACRACNRYISTDFRYCPYCGHERVRDYEFRQLLDEPFDRMEESVQAYSFEKLCGLEERLSSLESDLDAMLDGSDARAPKLTKSS